MAYCLQSDLETRIGATRLAELANDTAGSVAADPTIIAALIARADRFIDSYAGNVYTVPFVVPTNCTAIPTQIVQLSIDLTIYYCFSRRPAQMGVPDQWKDIYKDACTKLEGISKLLVFLDGSPTVLNPEAAIVAPDEKVSLDSTTGTFVNF